MKKLFIVIGETKDVDNDNGKEICQFITDKNETLFRGTVKLAMLSNKKKKRIATVLEEMLIPLLKLKDECQEVDVNENLKDEVIDVKNLDESEVQFLLESCLDFIAGGIVDVDAINEIAEKATARKVVVPANATFN